MNDFKDLLKAGVHFGHKTSFGSPKMRPFIWGSKNRIHLIDISKTAALMEYAGKKLKNLVLSGKSILWVGTKKPAQAIIKKAATDLNMPFVINRWIGGTLSNYGQVKKAITRLLHLRDILKKPTTFYTKKELVMLQKQLDRLERNVGGIIDLDFPPAAIVVVDAKKEQSAIKEAFGMNIPVIALVDTNTDPTLVSCVIPGNDDSPKSIRFVIEYLANYTSEGQKEAKEAKKKAQEEKTAKKVAAKKTEVKTEVKEKKAVEENEKAAKTETTKKKTTTAATKKIVKKAVAKKTVEKKVVENKKVKKVAEKK